METQFKPGSFVLVPNKNHLRLLSMKAQVVWLALCAHADSNGHCWPSINRLSHLTGIGEKTIKKGIEELRSKHWVRKYPRFNEDGSHRSNHYTLYQIDQDYRPPSLLYVEVEGDVEGEENEGGVG